MPEYNPDFRAHPVSKAPYLVKVTDINSGAIKMAAQFMTYDEALEFFDDYRGLLADGERLVLQQDNPSVV